MRLVSETPLPSALASLARMRRDLRWASPTRKPFPSSRWAVPTLRLLLPRQPPLIGQDHGRLDLPLGNGPVGPEQPIFLLWGYPAKPVLLIEANRPGGIGPGAEENGPLGLLHEEGEQGAAYTLPLPCGPDVGVPDERHIPNILEPHDPDKLALFLVPPEGHTRIDLVPELVPGHVGSLPTVRRDGAPIGLGSLVDDGEHRLEVPLNAAADHRFSLTCKASRFASRALPGSSPCPGYRGCSKQGDPP